MRRTHFALVLAATLGVVVAAAGTSAAAPATRSSSTITEKVDGFVHGYPGDCPDDLPSTPLVCHEWDIVLYRNGTTAQPGGVAPPHSRWVLLALRHTLTFAGDGSEPVESDAGFGFLDGADVTFDSEHLAYASVRAPGLELTDGSVVDLTATWTATSGLSVFGNDSPALADFGQVRHFHDDCINVVKQGHQKIRESRVQSVVDGVESPYGGGIISTSQFTSIEVHSQKCG
jgi:hypothetical protein